MTTNQKVNKEAVRMLVQDVGYAIASNQTGIPQPTLRQWAKRGGWNGRSVPHAQAVTTVTRSPADIQAEVIAANGRESKHKLSIAARKASETFAKMNGNHVIYNSKEFKDITTAAGQIHGWNENQGQAQFSLNVLNLGGSVQIGRIQDDAVAHTKKLVEGSETDQASG